MLLFFSACPAVLSTCGHLNKGFIKYNREPTRGNHTNAGYSPLKLFIPADQCFEGKNHILISGLAASGGGFTKARSLTDAKISSYLGEGVLHKQAV